MAEPSVSLVDARPVRAVSTNSAWDQAVELRDRLATAIRQTLDQEGVEALVLESQVGNYPPWVRLEAWLPAGGASVLRRHRGELEFVIDAAPYRKHTLVLTGYASRGHERIAVSRWPTGEFATGDAREWTLYALGRGGKPSNYRPVMDALIGMVTAFLPFVHGPHHNPIRGEFRNALRLNGAKCLMQYKGAEGSAGGGRHPRNIGSRSRRLFRVQGVKQVT